MQRVTYRADDTGYTVMQVQVKSASSSSSAGASSSDASTSSLSSSIDGASDADAVAAAAEAVLGGARGGRPGRRPVITVVGAFQAVAAGQTLRLHGSWVQHKQYGWQLKAHDVEEVAASSEEELIAYLGGGAIPGVGPVTARVRWGGGQPGHGLQRWGCVRGAACCWCSVPCAPPAPPRLLHLPCTCLRLQSMVSRWGLDIEAKLSRRDAVRSLEQCPGIGRAKAETIKEAWDQSKGAPRWCGVAGRAARCGVGDPTTSAPACSGSGSSSRAARPVQGPATAGTAGP